MGFVLNLPGQHGYHCIFVEVDQFLKKDHIIPCKNSIDAFHVVALFSKEEFHLNGVLESIIVTPQTQNGPKHEKNISKAPVDFFLFDKSIQIILIKYQHQELS